MIYATVYAHPRAPSPRAPRTGTENCRLIANFPVAVPRLFIPDRPHPPHPDRIPDRMGRKHGLFDIFIVT
ncbi:MAG: hypothetical protein GDA56_23720 [Hormoscilla sp. GM7CHS1pb]|nr:hypothetical protein [Hormoscilla sp. GM7CHS1pb]